MLRVAIQLSLVAALIPAICSLAAAEEPPQSGGAAQAEPASEPERSKRWWPDWLSPRPKAAPKTPLPAATGNPDGSPAEPDPAAGVPMPSQHDFAALAEVNRVRFQHGVPAVRFDAKLFAAAWLHSREQMRGGYLGHEGLDATRATLGQRMHIQNYTGRTYAEVVAKDFPDARSVVAAWMDSPLHREVLLDPDLVEAAFARFDGPASRTNRWTGDFADPGRSYTPLPTPRHPGSRPDPERPEAPAPPEEEADVSIQSGTGFFVASTGYVVTSLHVVEGTEGIAVRFGEEFVRATVVAMSKESDLAVLRVDADRKFPCIPIAPSSSVRLAAAVYTVGFPNVALQGFAPKFSRGEVAGLTGVLDDERMFQVSLPVQPGNSGGALVDTHGNVVGVVAAKLSESAARGASGSAPENVNYAVKSGYLLSLLRSIPGLEAELPPAGTAPLAPEDVAEASRAATVLVLAR